MDLYNAARWLGRPFQHEQLSDPHIGDHGIIGDGFTTALIRPDGTIDWLCFPRFDSPSVFGSLLDPGRGGFTHVRPVADAHGVPTWETLQRYDPDTNVLETLFQVPGQGVLRLTDFMPWTDDARASVHEVHRRIECVGGRVQVSAQFNPRFNYGQASPTFVANGHGLMAEGPQGQRLAAVLSGTSDWKDVPSGGKEASFTLESGQRRWMILSWGARAPEPAQAYRSFHCLRQTRHHWREWARQIRYDGPWRHHVLRSALTLKLLIYAPTGAMVAAPTTSLPEWIGGPRNWDYRYAWIRDAAMAIRAANRIGCVKEAQAFFHFVRDTLDRDEELRVMYRIDGSQVPEEETLPLVGYRGSLPVRVGNGARNQIQLDTAGALIDAAYLHERVGGTLTLRAWRHLRNIVNNVVDQWSQPDHGIWEPRAGKQHNVYSKFMSWLALDRGQQLAALFGDRVCESLWAATANAVRSDIMQNGRSHRGDHFVGIYGQEVADASLLRLVTQGFISPQDPLAEGTVQFLRKHLQQGKFIHRYNMEDGVGGKEGAFVLCGFWLAESLAMMGQLEDAQEVFLAHVGTANHLGLLSEEVDADFLNSQLPDTARGALLGNFPQAFSHLGLINAAVRIDVALRDRDEGGWKAHPLAPQQRSRNRNAGS